MEWIEGPSIRIWLEEHALEIELVKRVMRLIGTSVGGLHASGVVHGDLTTSNLLLREENGEMDVVLIDFGLGSVSTSEEDMAVDLYVLERAFASTHPRSEGMVFFHLTEFTKCSMRRYWMRMSNRMEDQKR